MNLACQGPDIASHVDYGADAGSHWQSNHLKDGLGTYSNCRTEQEAELLCRMLKKSHFSGSITEVKIVKSDVQNPVFSVEEVTKSAIVENALQEKT